MDAVQARLIVRRVFSYYLCETGKNPKLYTLTEQRMKKGLLRLGDCLKKTNGDLASAEQMMMIAVDALAASPFHMGQNESKKKYVDWIENLFRSTEKLEWWLERAE